MLGGGPLGLAIGGLTLAGESYSGEGLEYTFRARPRPVPVPISSGARFTIPPWLLHSQLGHDVSTWGIESELPWIDSSTLKFVRNEILRLPPPCRPAESETCRM